jgi:hypothetical protein
MKDTDITRKQKFEKEKEEISYAGQIMAGGSVRVAFHLWNIREFELYRAEGYGSMSEYERAYKANHETVKKMLQLADFAVTILFPDKPRESVYLTNNHADKWSRAKKEVRSGGEKKYLLMPPDETTASDDDDEMQRIARALQQFETAKLSNRKGKKYKKARDKRLSVNEISDAFNTMIESLISAAKDAEKHWIVRKSSLTQIQRTRVQYYTRLVEIFAIEKCCTMEDKERGYMSFDDALEYQKQHGIDGLREKNFFAAEALVPSVE